MRDLMGEHLDPISVRADGIGEPAVDRRNSRNLLFNSIRLLSIFSVLIWNYCRPISVAGQEGDVEWTRPTNLSNTPTASAHPAILSDDYGFVHVLWSEEVGGRPTRPGEGIRNTGNTILYSRWDGTAWTPPTDILTVSGEQLAEWPSVDIDTDGNLHAVWIGLTKIYYSRAPSWKAVSAQHWSEPAVVTYDTAARPWGADILADSFGTLHVVNIMEGNEAGICYTRSTDGGTTWQAPIRLSGYREPSEANYNTLRIRADDTNNLHVVWTTTRFDSFGHSVYYARSTDHGDNWSVPLQLAYHDPDDFEVGFPYLTALGESELHLIYIDGPVIGSLGRYHRISTDSGETWSEPYHIITTMMGVNGYVVPIVDGAGQMHLIINMRTRDSQVVGIYHAHWLGDGWSPVEPVDVSIPSAHYAAVAVRLGNELHVVYTQHKGGEIWHIRGTIASADPQPALELSTVRPAVPLLSAAVTPAQSQAPAPTPTQPTARPAAGSAPTSSFPIEGDPVLFGVGASILLIVAVVTWNQIRHRRV